jgi:hypothetical protein
MTPGSWRTEPAPSPSTSPAPVRPATYWGNNAHPSQGTPGLLHYGHRTLRMAPPEGRTGMTLPQAQDTMETRMKTQARRASTALAAEMAAAALALGAAFAHEFSAPWHAS